MEEQGDCTSGVCPGASATGETVSIYVDHNHPLLQLQTRAAMGSPWRGHDAPLAAGGRKQPMAARAYPGMWPCTCPWWS